MGGNFFDKPLARAGKLDPFNLLDHSKPSTADPYAANWAKAYAGMSGAPGTFMNAGQPQNPQGAPNVLAKAKRAGALY